MSARRPTPPGGTKRATATASAAEQVRERPSGEISVSGEYRVRIDDDALLPASLREPPSLRRYTTVTMAKIEVPASPPVEPALGRLLDDDIRFERARESAAPLDLADFDPASRRALPSVPRMPALPRIMDPSDARATKLGDPRLPAGSVPRMPAASAPQAPQPPRPPAITIPGMPAVNVTRHSSPSLLDGPLASPPSSGARSVAPSSQGTRSGISREALPPPAPPWRISEPPIRRAPTGEFGHEARAAIAAFAGYGDSPTSVWETPAYAVRVFVRRRALAQDLKSAKRRRSPDVALYEAALRAADSRAIWRGIGLTVLFVLLGVVATLALIELLDAPSSPSPWP